MDSPKVTATTPMEQDAETPKSESTIQYNAWGVPREPSCDPQDVPSPSEDVDDVVYISDEATPLPSPRADREDTVIVIDSDEDDQSQGGFWFHVEGNDYMWYHRD